MCVMFYRIYEYDHNIYMCLVFFFFNYTATPEIYTYLHTLSLHDALPIWRLDRTIVCRVELRRVIVDLFDSCRLNFATSRKRKASRRTTRGYDSRKLLRQIFVGCDRKYDLPALPAGCLIGGGVEGPIGGLSSEESRAGKDGGSTCRSRWTPTT